MELGPSAVKNIAQLSFRLVRVLFPISESRLPQTESKLESWKAESGKQKAVRDMPVVSVNLQGRFRCGKEHRSTATTVLERRLVHKAGGGGGCSGGLKSTTVNNAAQMRLHHRFQVLPRHMTVYGKLLEQLGKTADFWVCQKYCSTSYISHRHDRTVHNCCT